VERIGFVGAGRAGTALARALAAVGWPVVAVASRTPAAAALLAAQLPTARALADAQAVADAAELVFLTVPDSSIGRVAEAVGWRSHHAVVHTSGADSLAPLAAARRAGALVGALHPLQTFSAAAAPDPLVPFAGITCALDADPALLPRLEALVRALGARPLTLPAEARPLYHAAAVLASNYLVALLDLSADLWQAFGVSEEEAVEALLPLARTALANVAAQGAAAALTGPIARGDLATVDKHLAALAAARPETLEVYRALGAATLALAREHHRLPEATVEALAARLRDDPP
jgi:predicted short-subunit dehydrogenase-like oxidoreductase (DUF2520 family)